MWVIDGIPLHPLVVHAVVVLLPLAALGAVVIAVRRSWRRSFGIPVLLIALAGVAAIPMATSTGSELYTALDVQNPVLDIHMQRASWLLPVALAFLVLLGSAVLTELAAVRAEVGAHAAPAATPTRYRVATGLSAVAALTGLATAAIVVLVGHAGSMAVWQGIGQ
ncbi:hypothetical protein K1T35_07845 [Pseudonocardia sp. DSM 110487]|uniref:DUF2231 domain-containing protein n=1 Tax=Pseudonocardia sp. DSM 110487 TaxID=2865833 RepID=UPI001C697CE1|nr:DUF2231 domain-containing protein [Pseudonocardia sp. DSM 110487]QYN37148.1 hypothetical protein K1T35_07845 [Pseudonocardia sp. DSM 110487]